MKKLQFTIFFALLATYSFSQSESKNSHYALDRFEKYYNEMQFDSIYAMFSEDTKIALPLDKTRGFLNKLSKGYGKITKRTFLTNQDAFAVYKTELEKGIITLNIAVDNKGAITGLYAKPYENDSSPKLERNITKMHLPFNGEWAVFWGGDTKEQNYHVNVKFQKNA